MAWTDKMVEELKSLWQTGLTTNEIAKQLGVSKNSIVGKVHRLSLLSRPSPIRKKDEKKRVRKVKKETTKAPLQEVLPLTENEPEVETAKNITSAPVETIADKIVENINEYNVKLTDLDNHTCRWPIGDPKDENFHFCGKKVKTGQTYCEEHAAIAYVRR